jgi:hypothetical protein
MSPVWDSGAGLLGSWHAWLLGFAATRFVLFLSVGSGQASRNGVACRKRRTRAPGFQSASARQQGNQQQGTHAANLEEPCHWPPEAPCKPPSGWAAGPQKKKRWCNLTGGSAPCIPVPKASAPAFFLHLGLPTTKMWSCRTSVKEKTNHCVHRDDWLGRKGLAGAGNSLPDRRSSFSMFFIFRFRRTRKDVHPAWLPPSSAEPRHMQR